MTNQSRSLARRLNPRDRIADATVGLFAYANYPLAQTLEYRGDPGLFGPDSATWRVMGDITAMLGGIRALLIQSAHPEVVAGVAQHSAYRTDPLGRLSRTTAYVTATSYGAMPEVNAALAVVRRAHQPVEGTSERNRPYSANDADHASWVHNVLIDSFLVAHQVFSGSPLTPDDADRFVVENHRLGESLRAVDLPATAGELSTWVAEHPAIAPSAAMSDTISFLADPPLPTAAHIGYRRLFDAAVTTIPDPVRTVLGLEPRPGAALMGQSIMSVLRWAMGSSPSWWLAVERVGAPLPTGVAFRRPPPVEGIDERFADTAG